MALRDKLRQRLQPLMESGEQIQEVFLAQSGPNPNLVLLTYLVFLFNTYYVVAVTERAVVLCKTSAFAPAQPKEVTARLPRETRIGPVGGPLWSRTSLLGRTIWVHRRFYKDVEAADAGLAAT